MPYKQIDIPIVGNSSESVAYTLSNDVTVNMFPVIVDTNKSYLHSWPGSVLADSSSTGNYRGSTIYNSKIYVVRGTTLYSITSTYVVTSIGTIPGSQGCIFAVDLTNLVIATGTAGYVYNGTTLTQITDADFQLPNSVCYINKQMILDADGNTFQVMEVNDPLTLNALNFGTADTYPDAVTRVYSFKGIVYIMGTDSIEPWYSISSGNPPFAKNQSAVVNLGLGAIYSVANSKNYMYFLGSDGLVYKTSQYQPQAISTDSINRVIQGFDFDDAVGSIIDMQGQVFYILNFTTGNKTLVYSETTQTWFNLEDGVLGNRHRALESFNIFDKVYFFTTSGDLYYFSATVYTNNSETFIRERQFSAINATNAPGSRRLLSNECGIIADRGTGLISGQGSNPQIMFDFSYDGGQSWTGETWVDLGRLGETVGKTMCYKMNSFYTLNVSIAVSDPVKFNIHSFFISIKDGGR